MDTPSPPPLPPVTDPSLDVMGASATAANMAALQTTAQQDTASLMARYGRNLALANTTGGAPLSIAAMMPGAIGTRM